MSKKTSGKGGIIFSTDPGFKLEEASEDPITLLPGEQRLKVILDRKQRAGKSVTLVIGFTGSIEDLEKLAKQIKTFCGTGGSAKDGEIIIQGDNRQKISDWLLKQGYKLIK